MKDTVFKKKVQELQVFLHNLYFIADTGQRDALEACVKKVSKDIKNGRKIDFEKELSIL